MFQRARQFKIVTGQNGEYLGTLTPETVCKLARAGILPPVDLARKIVNNGKFKKVLCLFR
jgi:hypothetical protein